MPFQYIILSIKFRINLKYGLIHHLKYYDQVIFSQFEFFQERFNKKFINKIHYNIYL